MAGQSVSVGVSARVPRAAGARYASCYPTLAWSRPPWPTRVRFSQGVPPPHALACGRQGGGGGRGEPRLRGSVPAGGAPRVAGPCPPPPVRHPGLGPLGAGSSPWPSPAVPSATRVTAFTHCGAAGGGGGAWLALRRNVLQPSWAFGGAWHSYALEAAARVSGQRVRRRLHCRVRSRILCRRLAPSWHESPPCVPAAVVAPQAQGSRLPPICPCALTAGGGVAQARGGMACWGKHPGPLVCTHPLLCSPSGVRGSEYRVSGQTPGESAPAPPAASAIARGLNRHLRLCLCGGAGCGSGG